MLDLLSGSIYRPLMRPFIQSQIESLVEDLRFLELFAGSPNDVGGNFGRLLQDISSGGALRLPIHSPTHRRLDYGGVLESPERSVLHAIDKVRKTIDLLESLKESPIPPRWIAQARRSLAQAAEGIVSDDRARAAQGIGGLYVIVSPDATRGRPVVDVAEGALRGGASVLQLRDKTGERGHALDVAKALCDLCSDYGAMFFVNDDTSLGVSCGADGVHLGQSDLPVQEARGILARTQLIGRSNNTIAELADSLAQDVDYVAVGAVFHTTTVGKGARPAIGLDGVRKARECTSKPIVAIGGIDARNAAAVVAAGADCVAVISAVTMADDPRSAAARLVDEVGSSRRSP